MAWFALNDDRPLSHSLASERRSTVIGNDVYGFLATSQKAVDEPIHAKTCASRQ
ncbi:hypothetical protein ACO2JO_18700 [Leptospira interrogans]